MTPKQERFMGIHKDPSFVPEGYIYYPGYRYVGVYPEDIAAERGQFWCLMPVDIPRETEAR